MYKYRAYGMTFESDMVFYECEEADASEPAVMTIRYNELSEIKDEISAQNLKRVSHRPNGEMPSMYTKKEDGVFNVFIYDMAYIRIIGDSIIEYNTERGTDDIVFHQWMLCYAMTLLLIKKHEVLLHCAGLLVPGTDDAILVCGDSGAGKSTISNALLEKGMQFVSDDSVRVINQNGKALVYGACKQRRLCDDVVKRKGYDTSKLRCYDDGEKYKWIMNMDGCYYGDKPRNLKSIFIITLKETGDPEVTEVTGAEKINRIMRALYKGSDYKAEGFLGELFLKVTNIAKDVKVYVVERPKDKMTVDEITDKIYTIGTGI